MTVAGSSAPVPEPAHYLAEAMDSPDRLPDATGDVRRWAGPSRRAFWRAQAGGWLLFGTVYFLALLPQSPFEPARLLVFKLFWSMTGLGVSTALAMLYERVRVRDRRVFAAVSIAAASSLLFSSVWVLALGSLVNAMTGSTRMIYTASSFPFVALNHFLILLSWSLAYLALSYWQRSQEDQRTSLAALGAAREAQLAMLRYQLNPHFLFNAMTSVRALIVEHPERARLTLSRLSDFLRYTLGNSNGTTVTVAEEIQVVRDYLEIELVRFEEKLDVDVVVSAEAAVERVPGFLLHPLIENAIKHGALFNGRLYVRVNAGMEGRALRIEVANTGTFRPDDRIEPKIGVMNVRERLAATYPGRGTLEIIQDAEWVRAVITIRTASGGSGAA